MPRTPHTVHVEAGRAAHAAHDPHRLRRRGLADFGAGEFTDHYVKLQFPPRADYAPLRRRGDPRRAARAVAAHRTYTVRAWDPSEPADDRLRRPRRRGRGRARGRAAAQPGDTLQLSGPGGAYAPDPDADWHLLVGDPSVVPAISASLARIPAGRLVHVLLAGRRTRRTSCALDSPGDLHVQLAARRRRRVARRRAARAEFPAGDVHAFVHGEATAVRAVRRHLLAERELPREAVSISGYWKRTPHRGGLARGQAGVEPPVEADLAARLGGRRLHAQQPRRPARQPPVPAADQRDHRGHDQRADDRRVEQDARRRARWRAS